VKNEYLENQALKSVLLSRWVKPRNFNGGNNCPGALKTPGRIHFSVSTKAAHNCDPAFDANPTDAIARSDGIDLLLLSNQHKRRPRLRPGGFGFFKHLELGGPQCRRVTLTRKNLLVEFHHHLAGVLVVHLPQRGDNVAGAGIHKPTGESENPLTTSEFAGTGLVGAQHQQVGVEIKVVGFGGVEYAIFGGGFVFGLRESQIR